MVLTKWFLAGVLAIGSAQASPTVQVQYARYYGVDSKPAAQDQCTANPHPLGCWVVPSKTWPDPAPGFTKYFQVDYTCDGGERQRIRVEKVIEDRPLLLACPQPVDPTRIFVRAASYGGVVSTVLSAYQCAQSNHGNECRIIPSQTLWYDPLPGSSKMYNVTFACPGTGSRMETIRQVIADQELVLRCP